jgi:site-specific DNA-methyltransferase (adenine-specific)
MKKYNIIYADPPWSYNNKGMKYATDKTNIAVNQQYNLMTLEDLKSMPVKNITENNAVLFMWCVNPLIPEALELMKAWGFKYKTMLTWKKSSGSGYWFRGVTEHILFGVRGDVLAFRSGRDNFHECKSGKHSQKPHYFRTLITNVTQNTFEEPKRLELFARAREGLFPDYEYEGWDVYGDQINNSVSLETISSNRR